METKAETLTRVLSYPRPKCPDCGKVMSVWEAPIQGLEDGGGWGTPYLFVCFSDTCPSFLSGRIYYRPDRPGTRAYCRRMYYPGSSTCESICFLSEQGGKGQIIDETHPKPSFHARNPKVDKQVRNKVRKMFNHWGEFPGYPSTDWMVEVRADHTRLGYWDWIPIEALEEFLKKRRS